MSYGMSGALQAAVFDALSNAPSVAALIGNDIYDAVPTGVVPDTYVSLGQERVQDASDQTGSGALHRFDVAIITNQPGFATAKQLAGAISDVLADADLSLARGRLVYLRFERAEARRIEANTGREVVLRFRARVDED